MKAYIWQGNGISDAYHDDGTLVVAANTADEAREVARRAVAERQAAEDSWMRERDELCTRLGYWTDKGSIRGEFWQTPEGIDLNSRSYPFESDVFDGSDSALDREPDRVVDLDKPAWIAFNGGGYD